MSELHLARRNLLKSREHAYDGRTHNECLAGWLGESLSRQVALPQKDPRLGPQCRLVVAQASCAWRPSEVTGGGLLGVRNEPDP